MKTEPNEPINSIVEENNHDGYKVMQARFKGLTKREYFAAKCMAAYSANAEHTMTEAKTRAKWAVEDADALINALNL